jgi:hypothetical protein
MDSTGSLPINQSLKKRLNRTARKRGDRMRSEIAQLEARYDSGAMPPGIYVILKMRVELARKRSAKSNGAEMKELLCSGSPCGSPLAWHGEPLACIQSLFIESPKTWLRCFAIDLAHAPLNRDTAK